MSSSRCPWEQEKRKETTMSNLLVLVRVTLDDGLTGSALLFHHPGLTKAIKRTCAHNPFAHRLTLTFYTPEGERISQRRFVRCKV